MSHPKRHHYLPESYLLGFSNDGRGLWVYHINTHKLVPQTARDTCAQSYYNAFETEDGTKNFEIETKLSQVEGDAVAIIKIVDAGQPITAEQKAILAYFVSLQRLRTPEFEKDVNRSAAHMMTRLMRMTWANEERAQAALDHLAETEGKPPEVSAQEMVDFAARGEYDLNIHRNLSLDMMVRMAPEFAITPTRIRLSRRGLARCSTSSRSMMVSRGFVSAPAWATESGRKAISSR